MVQTSLLSAHTGIFRINIYIGKNMQSTGVSHLRHVILKKKVVGTLSLADLAPLSNACTNLKIAIIKPHLYDLFERLLVYLY